MASGIGFLGAGLAQGLSQGYMQGEQLKRQKAIQEAYMKHQAAQDEMMKQFRDSQEQHARYQEATAPLEKINTPVTAPALAPGFAEAQKYAADPSGYSKTFPATPAAPNYVMQMPGQEATPLTPVTPTAPLSAAGGAPPPIGAGAGAFAAQPPQPTEPPMSPAGVPHTFTGAEAYGRAIQEPMQQAGDLYQGYLDKMFGQKKELANMAVIKQMAAMEYRNALSQTKDVNQAILRAKLAVAQKLLGSNVQLPEGMGVDDFLNQIPAMVGAGGGEALVSPDGKKKIVPGTKPLGSADAKIVNANRDGQAIVDGLLDSLRSGRVQTGLSMQIRTSPTVNKIASLLGTPVATDEEQKAATMLGEHLLVVARNSFPGRVSNFDIQFLEPILGRPGYSNEVNISKLEALKSWMRYKVQLEAQGLGERGMTVPMDQLPGGLDLLRTYGGGGGAAPAGIPGMPPGGVPLPNIQIPGR